MRKGADIRMKKFIVSIEETLEKIIEVEAKDKFEAIEKVRMRYNNGDIILYPEDITDTEYSVSESCEQH